MKNALDCYYDYKLDKFIPLEDIQYKNNRDINLLIEELRQYTNLKNEQDINREYKPSLEWKQEEIGGLMKSPYETLNWFYIHDIPFLPLAKRGNAVNCRIGLSKQKVFIPLKYFDITNEEIKLKDNVNLEWFWNKKNTQNNVNKFLEETNFKSEVE